jgi:hypothetical protein
VRSDEIGRRLREQDLATVSGVRDALRAMHLVPDVVAAPDERLSGVQSDAHAQL